MFFYSNVPLVDKKKCPSASNHNRLAKEFNKRLTGPGPASAWNIFFYADSIFLGPRNTATPGVPLGVNPPEDEWWKTYYNIEQPAVESGWEGANWPQALAGTPQGANVMNPLNAYIFGRVTYENKRIPQMGPWAEGNLFDKLVESSRAVHANSVFWANSFRQRGAFKPSSNYNSKKHKEWRGGLGRYLPSTRDPVIFSKGLFWVGRSSDHFFNEYASQHVYMRYPPAVYAGSYVDRSTSRVKTPSLGILKRKNATKDILQWILWVYTFYFRGNEQQRSLFCETKTWDAPVINFIRDADRPYRGEQVYGERSVRTSGPLNICKVGFDFFKYQTRQNIFAPVLGTKLHRKNSDSDDTDVATDSMGYAKMDQYRPVLKFEISSGNESNNWGVHEGPPRTASFTALSLESRVLENYDDPEATTGDFPYESGGGKCLRFKGNHGYDESEEPTEPPTSMLFKFSSDYFSGINSKETLKLGRLMSDKQKKMRARPCLAGYYLQTNGLTNSNFRFVFRIWKGKKVIHETLIYNKYSYKVNGNAGKVAEPAYVYNKMFYFKNPVTSGDIRFEIVPFTRDQSPTMGSYPTDKGGFSRGLSTQAIFNSYNGRYQEHEKDKIIAFGDPYSSVVDSTKELAFKAKDSPTIIPANGSPDVGQFVSVTREDDGGQPVPSYLRINSSETGLSTGDMVKVLRENADGKYTDAYASSGRILFLNISEPDDEDDPEYGFKKVYFGNRRDSRLKNKNPGAKDIDRYFDIYSFASNHIKIQKMSDSETFKATLEPAILLKQRPTFQDAYSLLRVATAKKAGDSNSLLTMAGFDPKGMDQVGHGFYESNKVFENYIKYGSGANINGGEVVKALRQKVNYNPLYESARKFISSYLRMADRTHLINYRVEKGRGVLYFRRFNPHISKKSKSTILDNMEPSIDPSGRFHDALSRNIDNLPSTRYKPIIAGVRYYMHIPVKGGKIKYNGNEYGHGSRFTGNVRSSFLESTSTINIDTVKSEVGAYEIDGIRESVPYGYETNEWVMFMNSVHYKNGGIYKPSIYGDIMGFLNNRCHHRSHEYERTMGEKYDMIREELMRTPTLTSGHRYIPGPRLQVFLSKSSNNYNYIFNTNDPKTGNLDTYGVIDYIKKYRASCPPVNRRPYKVKKCTLVHPLTRKSLENSKINPSYKRASGGFGARAPSDIIRVELDRPLSKTGRLNVGSRGYRAVSRSSLLEEPYRTDENAIIEYLHHRNLGYECKRMMLGDYGTSTEVHEGSGWRPQGACYPRFYFLKLIPKVGKDSLLDVAPYAQMDFYMRAMAGEFVVPFRYDNSPYQVGSTNWKFNELASRSAEEDPTAYYYVDPREISGR